MDVAYYLDFRHELEKYTCTSNRPYDMKSQAIRAFYRNAHNIITSIDRVHRNVDKEIRYRFLGE